VGLPVVDLHNDLLTAVQHQHERDITDSFESFWLPQLRAGGVAVQVLPFFTEEQYVGEGALRRCLTALDLAHELVGQHADDVVLVQSASELDDRADRVRLLLALEGLEPVGRDLAVLRVLHRLGVRMASLTWNRRTMFADGQEQHLAGGRLTALGVAAVAEMERLGMVIDVSHLSDAGFWHVEEVANRPYLASHSSCRALVDHPRNLDDAQLRAIGALGGVVGINFWGRFLGLPGSPTAEGTRRGGPPADAVDLAIDHVEHALAVAGEHAVALGPDYMHDWTARTDPILGRSALDSLDELTPQGLRRPDELVDFTERLVHRLGPQIAANVAGGNALRLLREVLT
jgi:membrane dipeptidase